MAEKKPRGLGAEALYQYALRALSARALTAAELREKLLRRAESSEDVGPILSRLKQYGYLDDVRFAENFSASRLENEGFGRGRVLRDLRKRRVAPPVAEDAVSQAYREADEIKLIENFLQRKYRGLSLDTFLAQPKNLAAAYRRMRAAGFSGENSLRVLKRFAAEPEILDSLEEAGEESD
jgi:regulatory protein